MLYTMVTIKDAKANVFTPPSFFRHAGQAIRAFIDTIRQGTAGPDAALMHRYPGDYDLYEIGTFDDETGETVTSERPKLLYNGSNAAGETN